jgi:hypothetical protein
MEVLCQSAGDSCTAATTFGYAAVRPLRPACDESNPNACRSCAVTAWRIRDHASGGERSGVQHRGNGEQNPLARTDLAEVGEYEMARASHPQPWGGP